MVLVAVTLRVEVAVTDEVDMGVVVTRDVTGTPMHVQTLATKPPALERKRLKTTP